jgi:hypothetical protein
MTFHFIITLASTEGGMHDYEATYRTEPGETRQDAYRKIKAWAKQEVAKGGDGDAVVVFFSLEPNELVAVAA